MKDSCPHCRSSKITSYGSYKRVMVYSKGRKKRVKMKRRMCKNCGKTFSKYTKTPLAWTRISRRDLDEILDMSCSGVGIRNIATIKGVRKDTVSALLSRVAKHCKKIGEKFLNKIKPFVIQFDELKTYIKKREKQKWIWIAFDAVTRLWYDFKIGNRDEKNSIKFGKGLKKKFLGDPLLISSDGFLSYIKMVKKYFKGSIYGQVKKKYEGRKLIDVRQVVISRHSRTTVDTVFKEYNIGRKLNTSFVERFNKTMRSMISRLIRRTQQTSKRIWRLADHLHIVRVFYNLIRLHTTIKTTPAIAAGLTQRRWNWYELLTFKI